MSYSLQTIPANTTFGQKKRYGSSDYISDKKSKLNVCAFKKQCLRLAGRGKYGWSSQAYTDFNKVKNNNSFFDFSQLYAGLYTTLDFKSNDTNNNPVEIIKNNITGESPTTIIPKDKMCVPYYQVYSIDPNGSLFGRTPCGYLNYMNFVRFKLQSKICVNVPPKHELPNHPNHHCHNFIPDSDDESESTYCFSKPHSNDHDNDSINSEICYSYQFIRSLLKSIFPFWSEKELDICSEKIMNGSIKLTDIVDQKIIDEHIVDCETIISCPKSDNVSIISHNTPSDPIEVCDDSPNVKSHYQEPINIEDYSKDDWFVSLLNPGFENYVKNYEQKLEEEKRKEELKQKEIDIRNKRIMSPVKKNISFLLK